jgi:hypothetical protein
LPGKQFIKRCAEQQFGGVVEFVCFAEFVECKKLLL